MNIRATRCSFVTSPFINPRRNHPFVSARPPHHTDATLCSATSPGEPAPPPTNATTARIPLRRAIQTALASGRRRLTTNLLISALDPRARTYDSASAGHVFRTLVAALVPLATEERPVRVVVGGAKTVIKAREWIAEEDDDTVIGEEKMLSVDKLVLETIGTASDSEREGREFAGLLVFAPPPGEFMLELRAVIRDAHEQNIPVLIHNHVDEGDVYKMLGWGGGRPREIMMYETAFMLAPFAVQPNGPTSGTKAGGKFVLMRAWPEHWCLWRNQGEGEGEYVLCERFNGKPSDGMILQGVKNAIGAV